MSAPIRAPFPYYGSKIRAADLIERLMGPVVNLVIPFAGSLGELLGRSEPAKIETVNDLDGHIVNVWRALIYSPEIMAELCDHPVHEVTLHAAHDLLVHSADELHKLLRKSPTAHDVELAAWWVWGRSCWLGGGWCQAVEAANSAANGGMRVRVLGRAGTPYHGQGVAKPIRTHQKRPQLSGQGNRPHQGHGVARKLTHKSRPQLSHAGHGVTKRQIPLLRGSDGTGVGYGVGINSSSNRGALLEMFEAMADRLRHVRITYGDWRRVVTPAVTTSHGLTGVSLDPPYELQRRSSRLYRVDGKDLSAATREWALTNGDNPKLRITLCGKDDEHNELLEHGWSRHEWRPRDGEAIWASPGCQRIETVKPQDAQLQLVIGGDHG